MSAILFVRAQSRSCQSFSISPFCTQFHFLELSSTCFHSISHFWTDLELIGMFLTNQNAEIVARILLRKYRLLHRKCDVRIFIHELQDFGKRTRSLRSLVRFPKSWNEWIKIRTKHFLCCNLFIVYITRIKQTH